MTCPAPLPANEAVRLARLRALCVLDSTPEAVFDGLARAASELCGMPMALLSLVDAERQWFKARLGAGELRETPRDVAFCAHAILGDGVMEVRDARTDPRFAHNPLVTGEPQIRFYAGAPVRLRDGATVGTLCVLDHEPRALDERQRAVLTELAAVAAQALEMRQRVLLAIEEAALGHSRLEAVYQNTPAMLHCADAESRIISASDAWLRALGYQRQEVIGRPSTDFLTPASRHQALAVDLPQFFRTSRCDALPMEMLKRDGSVLEVLLSAILERDAAGKPLRSMAVLEDLTARRAAERERRASEERYRALVEDQSELVSLASADGTFSFVNGAYGRYLGAEPQALVGRNMFELIDDAERPQVARQMQLLFEHGGTVEIENRVRRPDGEYRWYAWTNRALAGADGRVNAVHSVGRDITARKEVERRLADSRKLLQVTLESIGDAVITTDAQGRVQWLNRVAEQLTGWRRGEAQGQPSSRVFPIVDEESRAVMRDPVAKCIARGEAVPRSDDAVLRSRDGHEYGVTDAASPIRDPQGQLLGVVLVFHDNTAQRRMSREMSFRASHDTLTGLLNRGEFEARLGHLLLRARQDGSDNAVLYIDLDQFKLVNDACGHSVGDQLLRKVSALLQTCVHGRDTLARLGGDEFGILLEHCSMAPAQRIAQDICDRMEAFRFPHEDRRFRIGASIGLVPLGRVSPLGSTAAVLQAADTSCYAAKEAGRNRVHTWFDTDEVLRARQGEMQWCARIEQALDDDRFELFAQRIAPIAPAGSLAGGGEGLHCELLLRLREPGGALVPPGAFLPAAERFHLASRIDRWVLRHALDWLNGLGDEVRHIELVAINLSGQSLSDAAFLSDVVERLGHARFDLTRLCFEITETSAITHFTEARGFIDGVRQMGVKIALDDFGAGASSFGYLKTLPVDFLKIDGQFITHLLDDKLDDAAVRCFVDVARVIGVKTIAEFVERAEVLAALRDIGVDYAQGYLVHRPQPLEEVFLAALPQPVAA